MAESRYWSVTNVTNVIQSLFPSRSGDVRFVYHRPLARRFDPTHHRVSRVAVSVTPSEVFYAALENGAQLGFLHRPFGLDRRRVPRDATILACHKGFDEVLTVGYNTALSARLGLDISKASIIQGYKGDPERRIGLVAPLIGGAVVAADIKSRICREYFDQIEGCFGLDEEADPHPGAATGAQDISGVAIMNAFHPEEVNRVIEVAQVKGLIESPEMAGSLLYLTGAVRELGLNAAREKGMKVICVGHVQCEEWGVRYLASTLRHEFPSMTIDEIPAEG